MRGVDAGRGVVGIGAEALHGGGDPLHGPHQEEVQGQIDQHPGHRADEGGHGDQARQITPQLPLEPDLRHDDLDEVAVAETGFGHDADHLLGITGQDAERLQQPGQAAAVAQIDQDRPGQGRPLQQQAPDALALHRHRHHPRPGQELRGQAVGDHLVGRSLHGQGRQFGRAHALLEAALLIGRQRWRQDQQFRQHDEQQGEQQQARGQAAGPQPAARMLGRDGALGFDDRPHGDTRRARQR